MHEMLHWTSGTRLPVVMVNANRAIGSPWNIWCDHSDSLSQRDTGWIQIYCQSAQEAIDTVIQGYRIAEEVLLPVMILEDGFFLSHTSDTVDVPDQKEVDAFVPPFNPKYKLSTEDPHTYNIMADPATFIHFKRQAQDAMEDAKKVVARVDREFKAQFGRGYGCVGKVRLADADVVLVTMATAASTALEVIEDFRKQGKKVGLCRIRMFRPFPAEETARLLLGAKKIAVLDRDNSLGCGGIVAQELKSALYGNRRTKVFEFIGGLGGRDIRPEDIAGILRSTIEKSEPPGRPLWMGVDRI